MSMVVRALGPVIMLSLAALPVAAAPEFPGACREISEGQLHSEGSGVAVQVVQSPLGPFTVSEESVAQDGLGRAMDKAQLLTVSVPYVKAKVLAARTDLANTADPFAAQAWTETTVADVDIADGLVTAEVVKAATWASADVRQARTDTTPSAVVQVAIQGVSVTKVAPATRIDLPPVPFGAGSYLAIYEREEDSRFPSEEDPYFQAEVTVRMLHLYVRDIEATQPGDQPLEVIVSEARSQARSPTPWCDLIQAVSAGAYTARVRAQGGFGPSILVGEQHIGPTGGDAQQQLAGQSVTYRGNILVTFNATETRETGAIDPGVRSSARAMSKVVGTCLQVGDADCLIEVDVVEATSVSVADAQGAQSSGSVRILNLKVAGIDVCERLGLQNPCSPAPNTRLSIDGISITLNQRQRDAPLPGHTGLAVRAIWIEAPGLGSAIIARAHSSADFYDLTP